MVADAQHAAAHRHAVDVHVHRREKDTDLTPGRGGKTLRRRLAGNHHSSIGRSQHGGRRRINRSIGIAKEEQKEERKEKKGRAEKLACRHTDDEGQNGAAQDKGPTSGIDTHTDCEAGQLAAHERTLLPGPVRRDRDAAGQAVRLCPIENPRAISSIRSLSASFHFLIWASSTCSETDR